MLSEQRTDDCRWWLSFITWDGAHVALLNVQGLVLQTATGSWQPGVAGLVQCRRWRRPMLIGYHLPLSLSIPRPPHHPGRWLCRAFSRALDTAHERAHTTVRCVPAGTRRAKTLLTVMPQAYVGLTAPPSPTSQSHIDGCAEWSLIRTAVPGVAYPRSHAGLYLTADDVVVDFDAAVLMAPKCEASRWRMRTSGEGEATTATLQNCVTSSYLRATNHWLYRPTRRVSSAVSSRPSRASAFILQPV